MEISEPSDSFQYTKNGKKRKYEKGHTVEQRLPRHVNFDAYWAQWENLLFWTANKLKKTFGGKQNDYIGTLVIKFNQTLHYYDPNRVPPVKFSSYFLTNIYDYVIRKFLRLESEHQALYFYKQKSKDEDIKKANIEYSYHEQDFHLYRVPETDGEDIQAVMELFDTIDDCWLFFIRDLDPRHKQVIEMRFRFGQTMLEVGTALGISKERVRQLEESALIRIRTRLLKVKAFAELFAERAKVEDE